MRIDGGDAPRDAPGVEDDVPPDDEPARVRDAGSGRLAGRSAGSPADRPGGLVTRSARPLDMHDRKPGLTLLVHPRRRSPGRDSRTVRPPSTAPHKGPRLSTPRRALTVSEPITGSMETARSGGSSL